MDQTSGTVTFSGITCTNTTHITVNGTKSPNFNLPAQVSKIVDNNGNEWTQLAMIGGNQMGDWVKSSGLTSIDVTYGGLNSGTIPSVGVNCSVSVANYALAVGSPSEADDTLNLSIMYIREV